MANAFVRFEVRGIEDRTKTIEKGFYCTRDADFAIIKVPGDKHFEHEVEVDANMLNHWQLQPELRYRVDAYKAWKAGQDAPVDGTSIRDWPLVSPAQVHQLLSIHVRTIEQVADLSEDGLRAYGMGGQELKRKAQAYLAAGANQGKAAAKMVAQDAALEQMAKRMQELEEQNKALSEAAAKKAK